MTGCQGGVLCEMKGVWNMPAFQNRPITKVIGSVVIGGLAIGGAGVLAGLAVAGGGLFVGGGAIYGTTIYPILKGAEYYDERRTERRFNDFCKDGSVHIFVHAYPSRYQTFIQRFPDMIEVNEHEHVWNWEVDERSGTFNFHNMLMMDSEKVNEILRENWDCPLSVLYDANYQYPNFYDNNGLHANYFAFDIADVNNLVELTKGGIYNIDHRLSYLPEPAPFYNDPNGMVNDPSDSLPGAYYGMEDDEIDDEDYDPFDDFQNEGLKRYSPTLLIPPTPLMPPNQVDLALYNEFEADLSRVLEKKLANEQIEHGGIVELEGIELNENGPLIIY